MFTKLTSNKCNIMNKSNQQENQKVSKNLNISHVQLIQWEVHAKATQRQSKSRMNKFI